MKTFKPTTHSLKLISLLDIARIDRTKFVRVGRPERQKRKIWYREVELKIQ